MKVNIDIDGFLVILAENTVEAFALRERFPVNSDYCNECNQPKDMPIIIDTSILMK